MGQAGFRGMPANSAKPSKRVYGAPPANEQHLHGAAVGISVDTPPERKARGWGERPAHSHDNTANRTILTSTGLHLSSSMSARIFPCPCTCIVSPCTRIFKSLPCAVCIRVLVESTAESAFPSSSARIMKSLSWPFAVPCNVYK